MISTKNLIKRFILIGICHLCICYTFAQPGIKTQWTADGNGLYASSDDGAIVINHLLEPEKKETFVDAALLIPEGQSSPLQVAHFTLSEDKQKALLFTNTKKVWRYHTRGDYWLFDKANNSLKQLGKSLAPASLMFAKLSPDGKKVAYVSQHNIYIEDVASNQIAALTTDGTDRMINGTFDWAYEEEFGCRDGFRWSPDSKHIAYWKIDARNIRNYLMLNTTDSTYSFTIPVEYPKAGQDPSACQVWMVDVDSKQQTQIQVPGDDVQHYIPRMEWTPDNKIILQQLNRKQNESTIYLCDPKSNTIQVVYSESDEAWIDIKSRWNDDDPSGWEWIKNGKSYIWISEKDGWRHIYEIDLKGNEKLITKEPYDIIDLLLIDEKAGYIYFTASPDNATQKYLYRIKLSGEKAERLTPEDKSGTNDYLLSPNGKIAQYTFNNVGTYADGAIINLPAHKELVAAHTVRDLPAGFRKPEFFKVTTSEGVELDGWMVKPADFDPSKKYPVLFYVYGEPAGQTVTDTYGTGFNRLYAGNMAQDGYIYISVENRGTPAPKGRTWRKSIYRNIGRLNIRDQALAAKEILKWPFVDSERIAVWGWSGGGSSTLNLLFQYPDLYKTGIAVAAVGNQLMYDNIYQERYMGVPQESRADFVAGSPITHAKNLAGNLLYVHGTADDNVHYQNAEMLINELVKYNKQFQLMSYPNRSHSISEGEGTSRHLATLFTKFLREHCPPGGR
ncbi:S9 family peptidase [Olivibacter sitiensis]|uniref:S9 family peptidase n=1 Tax=Olivibacter sitiensis TaxID=376470 RepID=UPI0004013C6B|nr:S9 family peptidase [Olivibacter sitiensis]